MKSSKFLLILFLVYIIIPQLFCSCTRNSTREVILSVDAPNSDVFEDSGTDYDWMDFDWVSTYDSTCFSEIGYDYSANRLAVTFRDSGKTYIYHDVPESVWNDLVSAKSRGGFYNSDIKGQYRSERIDKD